MKIVLVLFLQIMLVVLVISQIIVPVFTKLPFFWIFKSKRRSLSEFPVNDLNDLEAHVIEKTESYKEAYKHVEETETRIKKIKEKAKV
jgi:hypothetical protein